MHNSKINTSGRLEYYTPLTKLPQKCPQDSIIGYYETTSPNTFAYVTKLVKLPVKTPLSTIAWIPNSPNPGRRYIDLDDNSSLFSGSFLRELDALETVLHQDTIYRHYSIDPSLEYIEFWEYEDCDYYNAVAFKVMVHTKYKGIRITPVLTAIPETSEETR